MRRKLYYTKGEILEITGLKHHHLRFLESSGFLVPSKIHNGRRYYSYENLRKLIMVSALLGQYKLEDIVRNFEKLSLEAERNIYKSALLKVRERIASILNEKTL
jgi:DNA-binding transcriptional MerR regulator